MAEQTPEKDSLPVTVDTLAAAVTVVYVDAEQSLIIRSAKLVRDAVAAGPGSPEMASLYAALRAAANRTAAAVMARVPSMARTVASTAARNGNTAAARELRSTTGDVVPLLPHDVNSARLMAQDLESRLGAAAHRITRFADDAYRAATVSAALEQILTDLGKATPAESQAQAWRELTSRGVKGFTDARGREWNLATYVEMAVRTATQKAYNASHRDRLTLAGIDYFTISTTGRPCPACAPWEGRVLADRGPGAVTEPNAGEGDPVTFHVAATIEEATAAGLFHPNAILGDHSFQAIGNVENAVRSWYEGPSVELTTARGIRLTVSPNHPVLTSHGWVAAERLRKGDQLYRSIEGGRSLDGAEVHDEFDQVQPGVADLFDALSAHGANLRVPAASDHLHGDGKFCKGEIDVVVTDNGLLRVADSELVEQGCNHGLSGASVQVQAGPGDGPLDLSVLGVGSPVRRTLAQLDATSLQATAEGRGADSEATSEVLAGIASGVEGDELVNVHMGWFEGHAYDFQTSFGAYALNSIVVHNCKHTLTAYLPGVTILRTNQWTAADEVNYRNTQTLRALEREVRAAKLQADAALTPLDRARAMRDARTAQARIRDFTDQTGLMRRTRREQIDFGNK